MELDIFKLERTREAISSLGLECALFCDFYNVSYLTGYTVFFENGPSPFTRGAAAALFTPARVTLAAEAPSTTDTIDGWTGETIYYEGYGYRAGAPASENFINAVVTLMEREAPHQGRIGVEKEYLPAAAWERIQAARPDVIWVELPPALMLDVRAIKSPAELQKIRACARLAETGQEAVARLAQSPGKAEIEVYSQAKAAMEHAAGGRFALQNALHAGPNADAPFPGMPGSYEVKAGDLLISDMVPYLDGYWGDTCSTFVVGGTSAITDEHRRLHKIAHDAFMKGLDAIRPGVSAGELDEIVRGYVRDHGHEYPHHTGHGLGVSNHEEPRIIIGAGTVLQAGMVMVLEPAVYVPEVGGVRQERMILVTESGAELLSTNSFDLAG
jgi:Xaa-Pro dipeptidase